MNKTRFFSFFLILVFWISSSLQGSSQAVSAAGLPSTSSPAVLALDTIENWNKIFPIDGALNVPAVSLTLQWEELEGVTDLTYFYCLSTKQKCPPGQWKRAGTQTSVTITNLLPDKTYYWWVNAYTGTKIFIKKPVATADNGSWAFKTRNLPGSFSKTAPGDTLSEVSPTGLVLSWGTSAEADSYEYCIDTSGNSSCDTGWINVGLATSASVPGLYNNSIYYWQVRAVNQAGVTYANNETWWQFTTQIISNLFVKLGPANLATGQPVTGLMLSWSFSQVASSYQYCVYQTGGMCQWSAPITDTSVTLGMLEYDATYYWQVQANTATGPVEASDGPWSFTVTYPPPAAFDRVAPANSAADVNNQPVLSWDASVGTGISYEYCLADSTVQACSDGWAPASSNMPVDGILSETIYGLEAGKPYYWQVRATNSSGTTYATGDWWSFTTEAAPGSFGKSSPTTGTSLTTLSPTLEWVASLGTNIIYQVCIYPNGGAPCTEAQWSVPTTDTTFALTDLEPGVTYNWQVRAENSADIEYADTGTWWTFTTPQYPASFSKSAPLPNAPDVPLDQALAWGDSSTGVSYEYCLDTSDDDQCSDTPGVGTGWVSAASGVTPALTLAYDTQYFWQVRARNSAGLETEADGGQWFGFTTRIAPPGAFDKLGPEDASSGVSLTPTFSWYPSLGAVSYQLCYYVEGQDPCTSWVADITETSFNITAALPYNTTYLWQVRAVNSTGSTDATGDWWSFTTRLAPPNAFSKLTPSDDDSDVPLDQALNWEENTLGVTYEYCLVTNPDLPCDDSAGDGPDWLPAVNGVVPDLDYGTTYYWQVRARNLENTVTEADDTTWWSFTTLIDLTAPADFSKVAPLDGATMQPLTTTLSWEASSDGSTYEYCVTESVDLGCSTWSSAGTSTTIQLSEPLKWNTLYYWQVRARSSNDVVTRANTGEQPVWWSFETEYHAPELTHVADIVVQSTDLLTIIVQGSDIDMPYDTLTYSITGLPAGATFNPVTGEFSWRPVWSPTASNLYALTVTVTDSKDLTDDWEVSIQVEPRRSYMPFTNR